MFYKGFLYNIISPNFFEHQGLIIIAGLTVQNFLLFTLFLHLTAVFLHLITVWDVFIERCKRYIVSPQ
jgi:hypothetical protein